MTKFVRFDFTNAASVFVHGSLLSQPVAANRSPAAEIEAQRACFRAAWAHIVDVTHVIQDIADIKAPYKFLDDPIPLRKPVERWLRRNVGKGGSWPLDPVDPWSRYGNEFGFHDVELRARSTIDS